MSMLFHGGAAGLRPGSVILPDHADHRFVEGCPDCEAHRLGLNAPFSGDPATPPEWVYATSDRQYARYYASRAVSGWLYRVELQGAVEPSTEDDPRFPTWRARTARVHSVLERAVQLTMRERHRLFIRWGGTEREWLRMLAAVRSIPQTRGPVMVADARPDVGSGT